jgi:transcriptional regulator with XRE-family HTH domain
MSKLRYKLVWFVWSCIADISGQRELARAIGMSAQYVCDVKKGRRQVGDGMLEKLMAGLA